MIPAVLAWLGTAAAAEPGLEARLLGPPPATEVAASLGAVDDPMPPMWPLLAAVGAGLLLVGARKPLVAALGGAEGSQALVVISRKNLGHGGIAVVDVTDPSGEVRRLLVGTGTAGPRLLADLSSDFESLGFGEEES